jgi:hypothetical protein
MTPLRCYNCGLIGHRTQSCARYGPRFPEPGKTFQDYTSERERIANLFASDIIADHQSHTVDEDEDTYVPPPAPPAGERPEPPPSKLELAHRNFTCDYCKAEPGRRCVNRHGVLVNLAHSSRTRQHLDSLKAPA